MFTFSSEDYFAVKKHRFLCGKTSINLLEARTKATPEKESQKCFFLSYGFEDATDFFYLERPKFFTEAFPNGSAGFAQIKQVFPWMVGADTIFDGDKNEFKKLPDDEIWVSRDGNKTHIVSYETEAQIESYYLIYIEEGVLNENGGLVSFYEGFRVEDHDGVLKEILTP